MGRIAEKFSFIELLLIKLNWTSCFGITLGNFGGGGTQGGHHLVAIDQSCTSMNCRRKPLSQQD